MTSKHVGTDFTLDDLTTYLEVSGWSVAGTGTGGHTWSDPNGLRLGVPFVAPAGSYQLSAAAHRLAENLATPVDAVTQRIALIRYDIANFRAADDVYIRDSIPVEAGHALFASARTMMRASATTARGAKAHIRGNYSKAGEKIFESTRLGHTKHGSYILPMLIPLSRPVVPEAEGILRYEEKYFEPEERRVSRTLAQALSAIQHGIVEPGKIPTGDTLAMTVAAGVSRELINALQSLVSEPAVSTFEANFEWSPTSPAKSLPQRISVPADAASLLKESAGLYRQEKKPRIETLTGPIVELRDEKEFSFGHATIQTMRNGRHSEVRVTMTRPQLDAAHDWFSDHEVLVVEGVVSNPGNKGLVVEAPEHVRPMGETLLFS